MPVPAQLPTTERSRVGQFTLEGEHPMKKSGRVLTTSFELRWCFEVVRLGFSSLQHRSAGPQRGCEAFGCWQHRVRVLARRLQEASQAILTIRLFQIRRTPLQIKRKPLQSKRKPLQIKRKTVAN